jgi:hypothetical protein
VVDTEELPVISVTQQEWEGGGRMSPGDLSPTDPACQPLISYLSGHLAAMSTFVSQQGTAVHRVATFNVSSRREKSLSASIRYTSAPPRMFTSKSSWVG